MNQHDVGSDIEEVLLTAEQIDQRLTEMGEEISRDYAGEDLLLVGVLRGALW